MAVPRRHKQLSSRVQNVLAARNLRYDLVLVETEPDLSRLAERSGRRSCPLVYVGEELIGGLQETIDAERSGHIARLIANPRDDWMHRPAKQPRPVAFRP
jgi:glutaredoxin